MEVAQRTGERITFDTCKEEWKELETLYADFESKHFEYRKTAESYFGQRNSCTSQIRRQQKKLKVLSGAVKKCEADETERSELSSKINRRKEALDKVLNYLPKKNGFYLSLIVGQVNLTFDNEAEKYRYKDEYEKFKLYCTIMTLISSVLNFFILHNRISDAALSFFLLWYYCTLTVRESILIANGSRIKGWWVMHHYVAVFLSGIFVIWPEGQSYQEFRSRFMAFSIYQSFIQLLQYYYQTGCLYRLRALGLRPDMDITVEGFHSWMWRGLTFLLPFLFFGHFWQLYNAYYLTVLSLKYKFIDWQVPAIAFLFFVMFCGNFFTTLSVVTQKMKKRSSKSKQQ
uniref:ion channel TACAN-like n=1 Tax=Styela clava TaxID=7725 RepID=UPI00193A74E4|nr:ion channel TACAN-like [Styela clava]